MGLDHEIDWDNVKIRITLYKCRIVESFLINQNSRLLNVLNCNDNANFPAVYSIFTLESNLLRILITLFLYFILFL